jgi:probable HAF family extracellular repeat protein
MLIPLILLLACGLSSEGQTYVTHAFLLNADGPAMIDINGAGSSSGHAWGINDRSHIVGWTWSMGASYYYVPRGWLSGNSQLIGLDLILWSDLSCVPWEVNMSTQVVGTVQKHDTYGSCWYPFIWQDSNGNGSNDLGELITLGVLDTNGHYGTAYDINEQGWIVGGMDTNSLPTSQRNAFLIVPTNGLWDNDTASYNVNERMTNLGTLGGSWCEAWDINASNDIVGYSTLADNLTTNAFLWRSGAMTNLNDLIPTNSGWILQEARGINDSGRIAGFGAVSNRVHAFLLSPVAGNSTYTVTDLGTLGGTVSVANALNEAGQVVGWALDSNGQQHAVLWEYGRARNLGELTDGTNGASEATDINNLGQIVGNAGRNEALAMQIFKMSAAGENYEVVSTNEFSEVVTQTLQAVNGFAMNWAMGWADQDTNAVYTLEARDPRSNNDWAIITPTNQWPVLGLNWTNPLNGSLRGQIFRVRATSLPGP